MLACLVLPAQRVVLVWLDLRGLLEQLDREEYKVTLGVRALLVQLASRVLVARLDSLGSLDLLDTLETQDHAAL